MTGLTEPAELAWLVNPGTLPSFSDRELVCPASRGVDGVQQSEDFP